MHPDTTDRRHTRRELLKMTPLLLAGGLLVPDWRRRIVEGGAAAADTVAMASVSHTRLAATFSDADVTPLARYPLNSYLVHDPEVDLDDWSLTVSGDVDRPGDYPLDRIAALPRRRQNTRHLCIEGWDVIGSYGGVRLCDFLDAVGAHPDARFVEVRCADDYYESIDMAAARHPQSLLCDEMYGGQLTREHGAPLRLILPTKLGYKQAKYLTSLRVTRVLGARRGYWVDQGYGWYGGL